MTDCRYNAAKYTEVPTYVHQSITLRRFFRFVSPACEVTETNLHFWLAHVVIVIHSHRPARVELASQLHIRLYAWEVAAGDVAIDAEGDDVLFEAASFGGVTAAGVACRRRRRLGSVGPLAGTPQRPVGKDGRQAWSYKYLTVGPRRSGRREIEMGRNEVDYQQHWQQQDTGSDRQQQTETRPEP